MTEIVDSLSNDYKAIDVQESIAHIQNFFAEVPYSHFPVIEEGIYKGCLVAEDIETFEAEKKIKDYLYTLEGFFVRKNMLLMDVLEVYANNQSNIVPVLDENNSYIGYYELEDVIKLFYETPFLKEQGSIIIVRKNVLDYSMSQIAQIIESNNGKVLGFFISKVDNECVEITIKVTLGSLNDIIQTFRRYNYDILSEHQEDNYINNLKERSDYLNKYLSL
ncbi:CBS domain-containing protein [Flavobacterium aciduliphilum]|uniref:CBS domain protein n=1 Tax=Flavobacterium aciduliphilum TaxID=1101402 RepID=A0A328YNX9_9FLAO|nr:CBS domain-containing protein [Flavobacterium aciduliphilum]RAR71796.1 CBS domain protein [Flavobacterium aciduliphilum]